MADFTSQRDTTNYVNWIRTEFFPLTLATPDETIIQCLENAIRYWNTHSGFKISGVYEAARGRAIELPNEFKSVVSVYPTKSTTWIWNDHPLWTLIGVAVLDSVTSDLIMLSEAFRNYRVYTGTDFTWSFVPDKDTTQPGKLFVTNIPKQAQALFVVGTKRILPNEDINNEYINNWILYYTKALVKQVEGNTIRKAAIIDLGMDGQELVSEGKEEQKELQEQLKRNARWVALAKRA